MKIKKWLISFIPCISAGWALFLKSFLAAPGYCYFYDHGYSGGKAPMNTSFRPGILVAIIIPRYSSVFRKYPLR
jgi:hypothetical protein